MSHKIISCAIHDYIEIACTFGYDVKLDLFTGELVQGKAITTETTKDKKEYLQLATTSVIKKVELINIKSMTAAKPNPHFDHIIFNQ